MDSGSDSVLWHILGNDRDDRNLIGKENIMDAVKALMDALENLFDRCIEITDAGGCDRCPIHHVCIDSTSVKEFADTATKGSITEFFDFAKDVEEYANAQERLDYLEELNAQTRREVEQWIH